MIIHHNCTCKYVLFDFRILQLVIHFVDPRC